MRSFSKSRLWGSAFGLALSLSFAGCSSKDSSDASMGLVTRGMLEQRVTVSGVIAPNRKAMLTPPYAGYVQKIFVEVGQKVRAGDPIVSVTQAIQQSPSEVYPMRSPFNGTVVQRNVTEGEYVEVGKNTLLVRIDDLSKLFVEANVPELELPKLAPGQEVQIRAAALGAQLSKGVIRQIALSSTIATGATQGTVEFPVRIEVTEPAPGLRPGMTAVIDIVALRRENALLVRNEFVRREGDKTLVQLEDGKEREVKLGAQTDEAFEVIEGLTEGEKLRKIDFSKLGGSPFSGGGAKGAGRRAH